jgi:hypothetical protein
MRSFTPWRGVDSPSWWGYTCLGFWFLILEHIRFACIALVSPCHIFTYALHFRNHICFIPKILFCCLEKISAGILWGWQKKHVRRLLFYLGSSEPLFLRTSLILPRMLGLDIVSFPHSMSLLLFCLIFFNINIYIYIGGEFIDFLFLFVESFSDITCIFAWYLSSLCIDWICLYMIESLCLISAKCPCNILMLDSLLFPCNEIVYYPKLP